MAERGYKPLSSFYLKSDLRPDRPRPFPKGYSRPGVRGDRQGYVRPIGSDGGDGGDGSDGSHGSNDVSRGNGGYGADGGNVGNPGGGMNRRRRVNAQ